MNLGPMEIGLLLFVMLFAFGPKRIPEIGKSLGEALSGFRKATREEADAPRLKVDSSQNDEARTA